MRNEGRSFAGREASRYIVPLLGDSPLQVRGERDRERERQREREREREGSNINLVHPHSEWIPVSDQKPLPYVKLCVIDQ